MKKPLIGICGLGLGYSLTHYLAFLGYDVIGVDVNRDTFTKDNPKVDKQMRKFIVENYSAFDSHIFFSTKHADLAKCKYILIFVATPLEKRRLSMKYVLSALESTFLQNPSATYLILSTLPIGGMEIIHKTYPQMRVYYTPPMVRAQEFLQTFKKPNTGWQLIGFEDEPPIDVVALYSKWLSSDIEIIPRSERIVEVAKLATNLVLSLKIVCANAIQSWLQNQHIAEEACRIINMDPRVGVGYFKPGGPAAGPCFPRDLTELQEVSKGTDLEKLLKIINELNKTDELV